MRRTSIYNPRASPANDRGASAGLCPAAGNGVANGARRHSDGIDRCTELRTYGVPLPDAMASVLE